MIKKPDIKIGIITIYYRNFNYGGLLQSYALTEFLNQQDGFQAEQISYSPPPRKKSFHENWDLIKGFSITSLFEKLGIKLDILARTILKPDISNKFVKRKQLCNDFRSKISHSAETAVKDLKALNDNYEIGRAHV